MTKRQRTLQELRKRRGAKRHHHAENQQLNIDKILRAFQVRPMHDQHACMIGMHAFRPCRPHCTV